ncbi:bifunctional aldolase/short-chain dehydrogenase [Dissulfurirhabdus thermomarina]|uniref:Bifunctional aldolase/short-chain dehydrogenase n=1 Tax=Dissulfurirhabdus thermomarina TaxID=1765737 RepID=A0A6N9TPT4_DISTH|nr:bifunctional aldolase/short-chain dehydrogenase [Dissulfurirhabdus thermomarina]NDY42113.1 bifunctional aldolase/short-chain dehydrogenase [Dissulfurirhabdus thermomarina]NMX22865.1 bifunctional aldolase/short-chain dehydrogenase [Dissulfurirhabdus thermomarina]
MRNLWDDREARGFEGDLGLRVYTSRLLGRDASLVLHGGGNTSVKIRETTLYGEDDILYVKGSGWDLATIEPAGFAPVRLSRLLHLAGLERLSDPEMVNELRTALTRADAPTPSIEAILHALLPFRYVDHTHADAVVTLTNTADGERRVRDLYGDLVVVIPYVMPGFDLARACAERFPGERTPRTIGMVLMNHGVFSFGETAKEAYDRMIRLVEMADAELETRGARVTTAPAEAPPPFPRLEAARLRRAVSEAAGVPFLLHFDRSPRTFAFVTRPDLDVIAREGPATPDHVIRTKRLPLLGRDVAAYARAYRAEFEALSASARAPVTMLDPAPRVVLDPELGMAAAGRSAREAGIVADIYRHTMDVIERATCLGGYRALPPEAIFAVEYWDLEQAKLRRAGPPPVFAGETALVTGAASGIGAACVEALLRRGAAVVGLDVDPSVADRHDAPAYLGLACDITDPAALEAALDAACERFGGVDMLVLNAGVFPRSRPIAELEGTEWRRVLRVNLDANLDLLRLCHPLLALAPGGGRVVAIGSKNVPAPGPGAAAYSASKAALTQLARVAALEWGAEGIRVNVIHPDAVFDTGIWTEEVLRSRAEAYGLSVAEYKRKNILRAEVSRTHVAEMAAEMLGPLFARTTGAQVPVDGGNDRVI